MNRSDGHKEHKEVSLNFFVFFVFRSVVCDLKQFEIDTT